MATLPIPNISVFKNDTDITTALLPFIRSVEIADFFNSDFTPSTLDIEISIKYPGTWSYKDKVSVVIRWVDSATFYQSENFFLDYFNDSRNTSEQYYKISCIENDLTLSEELAANSIVYNTQTILIVLDDIRVKLGLTISQNASPGVYLGTTTTTDKSHVIASFNSYLEVVKYICNTYGYIGNLSGKSLEVYKLSTPGNITANINTPPIERVFSIASKYTVNNLKKIYGVQYVDRNDSALTIRTLQLTNPSAVTNDTEFLNEGIYYSVESATERAKGQMYRDYYEAFRVNIQLYGKEYLKAGKYLYLTADYGNYEGYYILLKVTHKITAFMWRTELEAFPLNVLAGLQTTFGTIPVYSTSSTVSDFSISQVININRNPVSPGSSFDNYVRQYNPSYSLNIANTLIASARAENIDEYLMWAMACIETDNFTNTERLAKKNPYSVTPVGSTVLTTFPDWTTGGKAICQNLLKYGTTRASVYTIVDPKYTSITAGVAPKIDGLQDRFSTQPDYATRLKKKIISIYKFLGKKNPMFTD